VYNIENLKNTMKNKKVLYICMSGLILLTIGNFAYAQCGPCTDECYVYMQKTCENDNYYKICGNFDCDSCLEWSAPFSCGTGKVCTGNGQCVDQCTSHDYKQCYNDDVYWYDSCDSKEEKYDECGSDGWLNDYQCSGSKRQRKWADRGCSNASCDYNEQWKNYENCGSDQWTNNYQCSGNWIQRQIRRKGCGNDDCYDYYEWVNHNECTGNEICSNGQCVTNCTSHNYQSCYNDDVYWYDSCGNKEEMSDDCGDDGWLNDYQCSGDYVQRKWADRGCSANSCYETFSWLNYQNCSATGQTCSGGTCVWSDLNAGCYASPNPAEVGNTVIFYSNVSGGTGSYSYSWSNTCSGTSQNCSKTYSQSGNYTANLSVTSGTQTDTTSCSVQVNNQQCICSNWNSWQDGTCGILGCDSGEMYQTRTRSCTPNACDSEFESRCVVDSSCSPQCTDECSYNGQKECFGNGSRTCGYYDSDSCLDWSSVSDCGTDTCIGTTWRNYYCTSGNCTYTDSTCSGSCYSCGDGTCNSSCGENQYNCSQDCGSACNDECSYSGQTRCSGNSRQICGDYDSDPCLEWGDTEDCQGSTSCGYGSCDNDERPHWYCSGGSCEYSCSYDSNCDTNDHDYKQCYNNDVYWYDSSGHRNDKYRECGSDYNGSWGSYYCKGDNVYKKRYNYDKGCSNASCYSYTDTEERLVERCDDDCRNGKCVDDNDEDYKRCYNNDVYWYSSNGHRQSKAEECGSDYTGSWGSYYCKGDNVYKQRYKYDRGCSNDDCYSYKQKEEKLVKRCDDDCRNGKCVDNDECDGGPCCDNGKYKDDDEVCKSEIDTQYGCPWGTGCGSDTGVKSRIRFRYCSGKSSSCTGDWGKWGSWSNWTVTDYCSSSEYCSPGKSTCSYSSSCGYTPSYNTKKCDDNDVYWFDASGNRLSKYDECDDSDPCTLDSCSNAACRNELKCDGSTCSRTSDDYCESCTHCGDGIVNCDEDFCSCPKDVDIPETGSVAISVLAKTDGDYKKNVVAEPDDMVNFLVVVASSASERVDNVLLDNILPNNINYLGNLKINGIPFTGNVLAGIGLGSLGSNESKHISFDAKVGNDFGSGSTYLSNISKITYNDNVKTDSVNIEVIKGTQSMAAAGSIFSQVVKIVGSLAFWLVILFILALIVFLVITGYYWIKKKRLEVYSR